MKFTALPCFAISLRICLLVAAGISHQAIGNAQGFPCLYEVVNLHWDDDNFCKDDTAMLWITWQNTLVPDSFFWDAGTAVIVSPTNNDTIFVVGLGLYHGYIVDTSGCIEQSTGMWPGDLPYTPLVDVVIEPSHCHAPTGSIVLSLLPGGLPTDEMTYTWSNGSTDASLYNVSDGTYTVTISRENIQGFACPVVYTYTVPLISTLDLEASIQMDNSC